MYLRNVPKPSIPAFAYCLWGVFGGTTIKHTPTCAYALMSPLWCWYIKACHSPEDVFGEHPREAFAQGFHLGTSVWQTTTQAQRHRCDSGTLKPVKCQHHVCPLCNHITSIHSKLWLWWPTNDHHGPAALHPPFLWLYNLLFTVRSFSVGDPGVSRGLNRGRNWELFVAALQLAFRCTNHILANNFSFGINAGW